MDIWTFRQFDWALSGEDGHGRISNVLEGKDYVTEMWSEDYFTSMKKAVGIAKEAFKNVGHCLYCVGSCLFQGRVSDAGECLIYAGKHILNLLIVGVLIGVNIELGNFIKGVCGTFLALGRMLVWHPLAALVHVVAACVFLCLDRKVARDYLVKVRENGVEIVKNFVSCITCVGHAIPSWLPLVLLYAIPPVGIAFTVVKVLAEYTGIFDLLAYGGTAIMLFCKHKITKIGKGEVDGWEKLKTELNPLTSFEGTILALYALHVVVEAMSTIASVFLPGFSTVIKWTAWGIQGVVAAGFFENLVVHRQVKEKRQEDQHVDSEGYFIPEYPRGTPSCATVAEAL